MTLTFISSDKADENQHVCSVIYPDSAISRVVSFSSQQNFPQALYRNLYLIFSEDGSLKSPCGYLKKSF